MGEGAAFVVLERYDNAVARGAEILGEVAGYGMTCDAHHITAPVEDGSGAVAAIEMALADAGLPRPPSGTSTPTERRRRTTTQPRPPPSPRCSVLARCR